MLSREKYQWDEEKEEKMEQEGGTAPMYSGPCCLQSNL